MSLRRHGPGAWAGAEAGEPNIAEPRSRSDTSPARTAQLARARRPLTAKIRRWQPHQNAAGTMLGLLDERLPSGIIVHGCELMLGAKGKCWIALPAQPQTNRDGSAKLEAGGKLIWSQIVDFADRPAADRFRELVLDALRRQHPGALDGGGQ